MTAKDILLAKWLVDKSDNFENFFKIVTVIPAKARMTVDRLYFHSANNNGLVPTLRVSFLSMMIFYRL